MMVSPSQLGFRHFHKNNDERFLLEHE